MFRFVAHFVFNGVFSVVRCQLSSERASQPLDSCEIKEQHTERMPSKEASKAHRSRDFFSYRTVECTHKANKKVWDCCVLCYTLKGTAEARHQRR